MDVPFRSYLSAIRCSFRFNPFRHSINKKTLCMAQKEQAEKKMPYSDYLKARALFFRSHGVSPGVVAKRLKEEGLHASRQGQAKFFRLYDKTSSTARRPGSGRLSKLTPDVLQIVEEQMQRDDETTTVQLTCMSLLAACHRPLSVSTILLCYQKLGWNFCGSAYSQLIRVVNKAKCLQFAWEFLHEAATGFSDMVYTDETSIQLESQSPLLFSQAWTTPQEQTQVHVLYVCLLPKCICLHELYIHVYASYIRYIQYMQVYL